MTEMHSGEVMLYRAHDDSVVLDVRIESDTVWLNRQQLADLFGRDIKTIGKHIANARREELSGVPTVAKFATVQKEGDRSVERHVEHYNLDMVLSVGYRVKSPEGVHFRRWSNDVLEQYVLRGAALNERRLDELGSIVRILNRSTDELVAGVADVLTRFMPGLHLLQEYDDGRIDVQSGSKPGWQLTIDEARAVIAQIKGAFPSDQLFGREREHGLEGVIAAIYQGFGGYEIYPTIEEKAANLLYLVVKDHPLSDGNKRSAAALFVTFLSRNGLLDRADGQPRITNNALAAITLMVAMSNPREKELMVALIMRMIAEGETA